MSWNSCNSLFWILVRIVQLEQRVPAGVQLFWEEDELSFLSTWRNNSAKGAGMQRMLWCFSAVFDCWKDSRRQLSTSSGSAARAAPGQAAAHRWTSGSYHCNPINFISCWGCFPFYRCELQRCLGTTCRIFLLILPGLSGWGLYLPRAAAFVTFTSHFQLTLSG